MIGTISNLSFMATMKSAAQTRLYSHFFSVKSEEVRPSYFLPLYIQL